MVELIARHVKCGCGCADRREDVWQEWALQQEADNFEDKEIPMNTTIISLYADGIPVGDFQVLMQLNDAAEEMETKFGWKYLHQPGPLDEVPMGRGNLCAYLREAPKS